MQFLKFGLLGLIVLIAGFFAWNYLAGPLKERRDVREFGANLASCTPFSQQAPRLGEGDNRTNVIEGAKDGKCVVRFAAIGAADSIRCELQMEDLALIGETYAGGAEKIGLFGGYDFKFSSSDPDPLTKAMNSPACSL